MILLTWEVFQIKETGPLLSDMLYFFSTLDLYFDLVYILLFFLFNQAEFIVSVFEYKLFSYMASGFLVLLRKIFKLNEY